MNKKLTEKLFDKYPHLYRGHGESITTNLMPFGFEHGDGWYEIVDKLSAKITKIAPDAKAVQVKEKFGGLRFYLDRYTEEVHKLVNEAEEESGKTCERCGSKNEVEQTKGGWIKTLCKICRIEEIK